MKNLVNNLIGITMVVLGCCCGCLVNDNLKRTEAHQTERVRELVQGSQLANAKTGQDVAEIASITRYGELNSNGVSRLGTLADNAQKAASLTQEQLARAGSLIGAPAVDQTERIQALLSENEQLRTKAVKAEAQRKTEETAWISEKRTLEAKLIEYGEKYEIERKKTIWHRFWFWATGTFGLAGAIAFIVFCPAIGLPLLGRVLAWIVEAVPQLASFLGVVGSKVVSGIVTGVEKAKGELDEAAKAKLKTNLAQSMDGSHKSVVTVMRNKMK
jgi:hypothetical protein